MKSTKAIALSGALLVALLAGGSGASPLEMTSIAGTLNGVPVTVAEVDTALGGSIQRNWREMSHVIRIAARAICEERAIEKQLSSSQLPRDEWLAQLWIQAGSELGDAKADHSPETIRLRRIVRYRELESDARRRSSEGQFFVSPETSAALAEVREPVLPPVVATCFGDPITAEHVEAFASYPLYRRRAENVGTSCRQFEIDYSNPLVLSRMAAAGGVSVEELTAASSASVERATDEEVKAAALAQYGNTEPSSLARTRLVLDTVAITRNRSAFLDEVRRSTQGSCQLELPPAPIVEPAQGHTESTLGGKSSGLRVLYFGSFGCEHCAAGWKSLAELRRKWTDQIDIEFRHHFPDAGFSAFDQALEAACSAQQGRAWEYGAWRTATPDKPALEAIDELRLSREKYRACLADPRTAVHVLSDTQEALRLGLRDAIPSYVIGRRPRLGLQSDRVLNSTIEAELRGSGQLEALSKPDKEMQQ